MRRQPAVQRGPGYWLGQQRTFMTERGTTLAGYLAYYSAQAAERGAIVDVDQVAAIHVADVATRSRYEEAARRGRW